MDYAYRGRLYEGSKSSRQLWFDAVRSNLNSARNVRSDQSYTESPILQSTFCYKPC